MPIQKQCEIREMKPLTADIFSMVFDAGEMAKAAQPGQFVHIRCGEGNLLRPSHLHLRRLGGQSAHRLSSPWYRDRLAGEANRWGDPGSPRALGQRLRPVRREPRPVGRRRHRHCAMRFAARLLGERCQAAFGFRSQDGVILADELAAAGLPSP